MRCCVVSVPRPIALAARGSNAGRTLETMGGGQEKHQDTFPDFLLVPALIMRLLFPVIATVAIYLFMRGHDLPGGGFVAGLTMSIAVILQYMAGGIRWIEGRLVILPGAMDRSRACCSRPHRNGSLAIWLSVPDIAIFPT